MTTTLHVLMYSTAVEYNAHTMYTITYYNYVAVLS